jgi:hypothetical protein
VSDDGGVPCCTAKADAADAAPAAAAADDWVVSGCSRGGRGTGTYRDTGTDLSAAMGSWIADAAAAIAAAGNAAASDDADSV